MTARDEIGRRFPSGREREIVAALRRLGAGVRPDPLAKAAARQRLLAAMAAGAGHSIAS